MEQVGRALQQLELKLREREALHVQVAQRSPELPGTAANGYAVVETTRP